MSQRDHAISAAAEVPDQDALERVTCWTREPFVHPGEDLEKALEPGSQRRLAFDAAVAEIDRGEDHPTAQWRRRFSLLLGLERLLADLQPKLVDGTELSVHQVDALAGTLAGLIAELQIGRRNSGAPPAGASVADGPVAEEAEGEEGEADDVLSEADEYIDPDEEVIEGDEDALEANGAAEAVRDADPNAGRRFWFEHATGAGKTVAALGFVEASRTGGVLILTHRRNLVEQFIGELRDRGYRDRIRAPLLDGDDRWDGPVTVETYQWFVRNARRISDAYSIVICDEAHTALGEKTSQAIRDWHDPVFVGMTATGELIARHVTDLFPTQTSRFDLAQAARRGVISPLRCVRIPPGINVRSLAKVPLRVGEVDQDFDQEELAALLDQGPFNMAMADLYRVRFHGLPAVVYAAGVKHANNVAEAFRAAGVAAAAVSGETPKRELTRTLERFERGELDVLVNAMLLTEGWNSPRATVCFHLAPTASRRVYQQRVGRVTRRRPGKEAGIVVDLVHPATRHDESIVTLHSLLHRDVYRGGAIVVGPVRRTRGRRIRVERRIVPVSDEAERRYSVFDRELWRIAVEYLLPEEQHVWAALAGARVTAGNWRRAKAMMHHDRSRELRKRFLLSCAQRNRTPALRLRALAEVITLRDGDAFDRAVEIAIGYSREERREAGRALLKGMAERRVGRRDEAAAWVWRLAELSRDVHEEYAIQRWPETKRLLGLLVNSSGAAHARNARRLVHAARQHDPRLRAALLAAALPHTPEAEEVVRGARMRASRKPSAVARELCRNFPRGKGRGRPAKRRRVAGRGGAAADQPDTETAALHDTEIATGHGSDVPDEQPATAA